MPIENVSWLGVLAAAGVIVWTISDMGLAGLFANKHGIILVFGGVACVSLINYPISQLLRALGCLRALLVPEPLPSPEEVGAELLRLGQLARSQGGILALQNEGQDGFADGFLNRALVTAIAAREPDRVRSVLEAEIRQRRLLRQEDGNFFRSMGTLSPMIGLVGTLLGIIVVLRSMSDPMKVGPAMALAITASLYGIAFATFFCLPVAGYIRTRALQETRALEMIVEGVLELMRTDSAFMLELRLGAYAPGTKVAAPAAGGFGAMPPPVTPAAAP